MQNMLLMVYHGDERRAIVLVVTLRCENEKNQVVNGTTKCKTSAFCLIFTQQNQSIRAPRSAERRSGAALREAGARPERNSEN